MSTHHLSRRKYAAHRGCNESAVRKAIARGRITLTEDGRIDPARADREWAAHTDPARSHKASEAAKRISARSDFGEGILWNLDHWRTELKECEPEHAKETVEGIANVHNVSISVVLDWLRAGLPYVKTGNWNTGEGFVLQFHWTWAWLQSTATTLQINGEQALLRGLRLPPYGPE